MAVEAPPPRVAADICLALGCRIRVASIPFRHAVLLACGLISAMNFGNLIARHAWLFWQGTSEIFSDAVVPCGFELTLRVVLSTHNLVLPAVHRATNTFRVAGHLGLAVQRIARLVDRGRIRISVGPAPMLALTQLSNYLTLKGSFSAVSKPIFASRYALESSRRDLQNALS